MGRSNKYNRLVWGAVNVASEATRDAFLLQSCERPCGHFK